MTSRRLLLDSGVVIRAERLGQEWLAGILSDDDDVALPAVVLAEVLVPVEAADEGTREGRRERIAAVRAGMTVVAYDEVTAAAHAVLLVHGQRTGRPRGVHDLVIAATAVATGRLLVTTDARAAYGDLPGVSVLVVG